MASERTPQDSLSLEETNKVRISLGLAPIGADPSGDEPEEEDRDAIAERNFSEHVRAEKRQRAENELKERIAKQKNQRALHAKLSGATLGDAGQKELDAKSWASKLKKRAAKREAELASRRQKEMEEADRLAAYDERDLVGLRVAHDTDELVEGEDVILTLKDSRILEGEEDELQNVQLADIEADAARAERKRRAKAEYTGYDDEEFAPNRLPGKKTEILAKYDDGFSAEAVRTEGFRLGEAPPPKPVVEDEDDEMSGRAPDQKVKLSLDFAQDWAVSDYMREGDKGFKVKKRKVRKSRKREVDEDEDSKDAMQVEPPTFERRRVDDAPDNLVDDDDLQAALARARRANNRKTKKRMRPEDLAERIRAEREQEPPEAEAQDEDEGEGRITFDETSEFVRNVTAEGKIARTVKSATPATPSAPAEGTPAGEAQVIQLERVEGEDVEMSDEEEGDDELAEMAAREGLSLEEYRLKIDAQMAELAALPAEGEEAAATEEPKVTQGMAGVLALLRNQGTLEKKDAATLEQERQRERLQRQHDLWLADHRRRLAREEMEKLASRGTAHQKDQAQREYENRQREMAEARSALEEFKHYKPEVELKYHDEFGREMTPKEAWKSLSHRFHGKTSGRMKTEKRMKKIEEERKSKAMLAGDTPLGMGAAFAKRQEKTGQAHMVLSVGNKGSVQRK